MSILSILEPASHEHCRADRRPARHRQHPRHCRGRPAGAAGRRPGDGLRELRPRSQRALSGVGASRGRGRAAVVRVGASRQRVRLPDHHPVVRAGPRARCTRFVGARADDQVIFTRQTTDALNLLARCVPADATVIVFESEHHAALLPWPTERTVRLRRARRRPTAAVTAVADALRTAPEGPAPGRSHRRLQRHRRDLPDRRDRRSRQGPRRPRLPGRRTTRTAPRRSTSPNSTSTGSRCPGHKLYAPYGAGALIGRADWLNAADPYLYGGGATASVSGDETVWNEGPARHEGGSPNVIGAIALAAACAAITKHRDAIEQHERSLLARLRTGLAQLPGVHDVLAVRRGGGPRRHGLLHDRRA